MCETTSHSVGAGSKLEKYQAFGAVVAEWKATLCKIEEGTSITWEEFVAFLHVCRMTVDGCGCANYRTFAMCEGVLLWLLVKETGF